MDAKTDDDGTYELDLGACVASLSLPKLVAMDWTWEAVRRLGVDAMLSFFIGGIALALITSPPTYFFVKRLVESHRRRAGVRVWKTSKSKED